MLNFKKTSENQSQQFTILTNKRENNVIFSTEMEKKIDKIQHPFIILKIKQIRNRRELLQRDEGHL